MISFSLKLSLANSQRFLHFSFLVGPHGESASNACCLQRPSAELLLREFHNIQAGSVYISHGSNSLPGDYWTAVRLISSTMLGAFIPLCMPGLDLALVRCFYFASR